MLRFTCDYCGKEYKAELVKGLIKYGDERYNFGEKEPCFQCVVRSWQAKERELEKIKKERK